jgi:hypothetical protein
MALLLAATNCTRIDRDAKFGEKEKSQTSQPVTNNENENGIIELQAKINSMQDMQDRSDRMLREYVATVSEITKGLNDINTGYIDIYVDSELNPLQRRDLKHKILYKIEQVKKVIDDNRQLVQRLRISPEAIDAYGRLVEELKKRLEIQRQEIIRLQEDNIAQKRINLEQWEKNLKQREINFILKKNISSLEDQFKRINEKLQQEQEKNKTRYFLRITPNSFESAKCTEKSITLKKGDNMITTHPTGSFEWIKQRDENIRTLRILDWENFWMESQLFIVFNKELTKFAVEGKKRKRKK